MDEITPDRAERQGGQASRAGDGFRRPRAKASPGHSEDTAWSGCCHGSACPSASAWCGRRACTSSSALALGA